MRETAITVENLSKLYRIGTHEGYKTLRDTIADTAKASFQHLRRAMGTEQEKWRKGADARFSSQHMKPPSQDNTIWALRDVSFQLKSGEVVGVIGRNGAGKSTLLKILSKITEPTAGRITLKGRVGSLLEVGTGFHPELTGHENVYLYGAILGMDRWEVTRKFDEIVAFAGIEKFIETPVKRYSSGMYMRLAFAVAAHLETEILLVDEVLAVGDTAFQKKCTGKMGDISKEGRTVLFVSHNMGALNRLCSRALWIDKGELISSGDVDVVISQYLTDNAVDDGQVVWKDGIANPGVGELKIYSVQILNSSNHPTSHIDARERFTIRIHYRIMNHLPYCRVGFVLNTFDGYPVLEAYDIDNEKELEPRTPGAYSARCEIPGYLLNPGGYILTVNVGMPNIKNLALLEGLLSFRVEDTGAVSAPFHSKRKGVIRPLLEWRKKKSNEKPSNE